MDRLHLLPMELPLAKKINGSGIFRKKLSSIRRLVIGFVFLAVLGVIYFPAYHSVQDPFSSIGETLLPTRTLSSSHLVAPMVQLPDWTFNTSRDLNVYINPDIITTMINPGDVCSPWPYLIIVICSSIPNKNARMAIRNTWGKKENLENVHNSTVKIVFLLGDSENNTGHSVEEEHSLFHDIVQEKFIDTYNNLTVKSVMMLKWVVSNCNQAKYLMKTDDDMFINVPMLLDTLHARPENKSTLLGTLICNAKPILDRKNKWYTPKYMYSDKEYPNYLSGTGYVMSLDVAIKLYQAALSIPLLHLEDVFVTGVCAKRAQIRPVNHMGFSYVPRKFDPCILQSAITAHKVNASNMYAAWKTFKTSITCNNHSTDVKRTSTQKTRKARHYIDRRRVVVKKCV